jgi:hypothetical protein
MADEPSITPPEDEAAKAETIRITLPPKGDQPVKRETVRINLPGKPAELSGPGTSSAPKKETTKIAVEGGLTPPPPGPGGAKPFVPGAKPGAPMPPRPLGGSGVAPPPKPPSLGARPMAPLKPASPPSAPGAPKAPEPVKAAQPKKETARITLPPEGAKAGMPKATVKMQQTQPLVRQPSTVQASPVIQQAALSMSPVSEGPDSGTTIMSIAAFIFSLAALGLSFWAYSASGVQ